MCYPIYRGIDMKSIIYNNDNLHEEDISRIVRRAKAIIVNDNHEILLACVNNNHHLPGGHVEENETYQECLIRELREELGVDVKFEKKDPIISIMYYSKNYPDKGVNTKTVARYFEVREDIKPNLENTSLTEDEKNGGFELNNKQKNVYRIIWWINLLFNNLIKYHRNF